jgi:molybdopterin-guanine dinucleotide biosynthesis protein
VDTIDKLLTDKKLITVSGAHKGVGKTILSELLLKNLPGFSAIKVTLTDDVCTVTDDDTAITSKGTDTFRLKQSGALKVVWVKTTEQTLRGNLIEALKMIGAAKNVLIEGNSIIAHLDPNAAIFVADNSVSKQMKPSRVHALAHADVCVFNQREYNAPDEKAVRLIKEINPTVTFFTFDILSALHRGSEEVQTLKNYLRKLF